MSDPTTLENHAQTHKMLFLIKHSPWQSDNIFYLVIVIIAIHCYKYIF